MKKFFILRMVIVFSLLASYSAIAQKAQTVKQNTGVFFMENKGQLLGTDSQPAANIHYYGKANDAFVYFSTTGISYVFSDAVNLNAQKNGSDNKPLTPTPSHQVEKIDMQLVGANPNTIIIAEEQVEGVFNFFYGHCPNGIIGVKGYTKVVYKDVYPNIDLHYYPKGNSLKYDFIVHPGGNPQQIAVRYNGVESVSKVGNDINISTPLTTIKETGLSAFQLSDKSEKPLQSVKSSFVVDNNSTIRFNIPAYDVNKVLVIDPTVFWVRYIGGSGGDVANDLTFDNDGNIINVGSTTSADLPLVNGRYNYLGGYDGYIIKLTKDGNRLWCTYYGGSNNDNLFNVICDKRTNDIVVSGNTISSDFPNAENFQRSDFDGVTFRLGTDGQSVRWTNLTSFKYEVQGIKFKFIEYPTAITFDKQGNVVCTGTIYITTTSTSDTAQHSFVSRINGDKGTRFSLIGFGHLNGNQLIQNSELTMNAVSIDSKGDIYTAGYSFGCQNCISAYDSTFTAVNGNFFEPFPDPVEYGGYGSGYEGIMLKFNISTLKPLWVSFLGGSKHDFINGLSVDNDDNLAVVGHTNSDDIGGSFKKTRGGGVDAFIGKYNTLGNQRWLTYLGGNDGGNSTGDRAYKLAVDQANCIYVTGTTSSADFPKKSTKIVGKTDGFIAKISSDFPDENRPNSNIIWTYSFGSQVDDDVYSIALSKDNKYLAVSGYSEGKLDSAYTLEGSPYNPAQSNGFIILLDTAAGQRGRITATQQTVDFGSIRVENDKKDLSVTLRNNGPGEVRIKNAYISDGSGKSSYQINSISFPIVIANGSLNNPPITISFNPSTDGMINAVLVLELENSFVDTIQIRLSGNGAYGIPVMKDKWSNILANNIVDFFKLKYDSNDPTKTDTLHQTLVFENSGTESYDIQRSLITNNGAGTFSIVAGDINSLTTVIPGSKTSPLKILAKPTNSGTIQGELSLFTVNAKGAVNGTIFIKLLVEGSNQTLHVQNDPAIQQISLSPNPVTSFFSVAVGEGVSAVNVVNMLGLVVSRPSLVDGKTTIDVSDLSNGVYFVQFRIPTGMVSKAIVVNH